jgi:molybdopterin converting factor small subunit
MDALKSDTGGLENDDRETDENEDTVESLRARVAALEEELLVSKRAARLMRARK